MENETPWWTGRNYSHIKVPQGSIQKPAIPGHITTGQASLRFSAGPDKPFLRQW